MTLWNTIFKVNIWPMLREHQCRHDHFCAILDVKRRIFSRGISRHSLGCQSCCKFWERRGRLWILRPRTPQRCLISDMSRDLAGKGMCNVVTYCCRHKLCEDICCHPRAQNYDLRTGQMVWLPNVKFPPHDVDWSCPHDHQMWCHYGWVCLFLDCRRTVQWV